MLKRLEQLEQAAGIGRTHTLWDSGQGDAELEREIVGMIAAGKAQPGDRFLTISWLPSGGTEVPMIQDRDPFAP
jgi:hypothetical protein